jgi:uncharacterized damage-inducible protein DinB
MPKVEPAVAEYFGGWDHYQQLLAGAIAPLDGAQLDTRAAPHLWPVRTLANHVVAARAWWFHAWMGEGGPEFEALADFDEDAEALTRPAADIVGGLEITWALIGSCLRRWTSNDLQAEFVRPTPNAAGEWPRRSRQYIIWHVAEHDIHHGGEISFSLGMRGLPGIDL